jgi:hypothetical protein
MSVAVRKAGGGIRNGTPYYAILAIEKVLLANP